MSSEIKYIAHGSAQVSVEKGKGGVSGLVFRTPTLERPSAVNSSASQFTLDNVPSTLLSSLVRLRSSIPAQFFNNAKHLTLRINVTVSNSSVSFPPTPYWFKLITLQNQKNDILKTWNTDAHLHEIVASYPQGQLRDVLAQHNFDDRAEYMGSNGPPVQAGITKNFYLQLPNFCQNWGVAGFNSSENLILEFTPCDTQMFISGSASNIAVNSVTLMVEQNKPVYSQDRDFQIMKKSAINECVITDCQLIQKPATQLTVSATNNILLDAFTGKCPFMFVAIKNSGATNASNGLNKHLNPGWSVSGCQVDLINESQQSIYGGGQPLQASQLQDLNNLNWTPNEFYRIGSRPDIFLNFADQPLAMSSKGVVNGFYEFAPNHKKQLSIVLPAARTATVYDLLPSAAATGASGQLSWKGSSVSTAFTVAGFKSAIENHPFGVREGLTATVTGSPDAADCKVSIVAQNGDVGAMCSFADSYDIPQPVINSTTLVGYTSTVSTFGQQGLSASGAYDVYVYMFKFRRAVSVAGSVSIFDL